MKVKKILQHRHGLGLTRAQPATAVGVSTGSVSHILEWASAAGLPSRPSGSSPGATPTRRRRSPATTRGDVVAFHRPYKRIGVEKGDERAVMGDDHRAGAMLHEDGRGGRVAWKPEEIGGRRGASEVLAALEWR